MDINNKIADLLYKIKEKNPLVHHITNYVTANDCANITLAIGASPVMADDVNEVWDMVSKASSLVINMGTISSIRAEAMIKAGKRANELDIPIILDPVGIGATPFRTEKVQILISELKLAAIRGNLSEIKKLYGMKSQTKGVDCTDSMSSNVGELTEEKEIAKDLANRLNTVVAITGSVDIVTDGKTLYCIENGHKIMSKVTGTGCMCTSLIGACSGAGHDNLLAALSGVASMGIAGEIGYERLNKDYEGTGSLKIRILDAIYNLSKEDITKRAKISED